MELRDCPEFNSLFTISRQAIASGGTDACRLIVKGCSRNKSHFSVAGLATVQEQPEASPEVWRLRLQKCDTSNTGFIIPLPQINAVAE